MLDLTWIWPQAARVSTPVGIGLIGVGQFVLAVSAEGVIGGADRRVVGLAEMGGWGLVALAIAWAATGAWL
jgi:hypothetical protein